MDIGVPISDDEGGFEEAHEELPRPRTLPSDLPKSLDDRQPVRHYAGETEMYDAWQGNRARKHREGNLLETKSCRSIAILDQSTAFAATRF